jgi:hypothetical protein
MQSATEFFSNVGTQQPAAQSREEAIVAELCEVTPLVRHISLADCTACRRWRVAFGRQAF